MSERLEDWKAVREWVQKAENDLINAEHTLTLKERCPYDTICFHAQQCAEKYLKALLVFLAIPFPKIHDVAELLAMLPAGSLPELSPAEVAPLNPHAVATRYPGFDPLSREHAVNALEIARRIRSAVRARLPAESLR